MKTFIQNRKGQKIAVLIDIPGKVVPFRPAVLGFAGYFYHLLSGLIMCPKKIVDKNRLAFVMHGLSGFKEQPHIEMFAKTFFENGYAVVRFDTANTFGESDGQYENATTTNYYEDLEDVIKWAKAQEWYVEPFVLCGHSLGGLCVSIYAEKYPQNVKALAPIATVVSRKLVEEIWGEELLKKWKETGWREEEHASMPGAVRRLKWSFVEDGAQYDLLSDAKKLTMPVLLIVGEKDRTTPLAHQKVLCDALPGKKELHIIVNGPHTFRDPIQLEEIRSIFDVWIKSLE